MKKFNGVVLNVCEGERSVIEVNTSSYLNLNNIEQGLSSKYTDLFRGVTNPSCPATVFCVLTGEQKDEYTEFLRHSSLLARTKPGSEFMKALKGVLDKHPEAYYMRSYWADLNIEYQKQALFEIYECFRDVKTVEIGGHTVPIRWVYRLLGKAYKPVRALGENAILSWEKEIGVIRNLRSFDVCNHYVRVLNRSSAQHMEEMRDEFELNLREGFIASDMLNRAAGGSLYGLAEYLNNKLLELAKEDQNVVRGLRMFNSTYYDLVKQNRENKKNKGGKK